MSKPTKASDQERAPRYTNSDAAKKAKELATPVEEEGKQRRKTLLENAAAYLSVFAITLTIILFAYYKGYSSVFDIPVRCFPLDLRSYIPVALLVGGILIDAIYYHAYSRTEIALNKVKINPIRILFGFIILKYVLLAIHIDYYIGKAWSLITPVLVSVAIELVRFLLRRPRKSRKISRAEYNASIEDYFFDRVVVFNYVKTGLWIVVICIILAPLIGKMGAKANTDYETCEYNGEQYSVIVDYGEKVLAQKASVEDDVLTIYIDDYTFFPREGTVFVYQHFDSVVIVSDSPNSSNISEEPEQHEG